MSKQKKVDMPVTVEPVHLKSLWGMQVPVYLTIAYILAFLLVLFFIGFLPGILHSGKRVTFTGSLSPVSVHVDGSYAGTAPTTVFLESGSHDVVFSYQNAVSESFTIDVGHPVFFTWLFPRSQTVHSEMVLTGKPAFRTYIDTTLDEVVKWSAITEFTETYHYPPLLGRSAKSFVASPESVSYAADIEALFSSALRFVTSTAMLSDAKTALDILEQSEVLSIAVLDALRSDCQKAASVFAPDGHVVQIPLKDSPAPAMDITSLSASSGIFPSITGFTYQGADMAVGDAGILSWPNVVDMQVERPVSEFSLSALEVSEYQWALFTQDNPYWAKTNREKLVEDGMVGENYLAGVYPSTAIPSSRPIRNISWNAAQAFCTWLSRMTGMHVSLPTVSQWEHAAKSVAFREYQTSSIALADSRGPAGMLGGYWELTSDPFIPLGRMLGVPSLLPDSLDRVVKGGSLLNDPATITTATTGVLSQDECSETASFRIVWTK